MDETQYLRKYSNAIETPRTIDEINAIPIRLGEHQMPVNSLRLLFPALCRCRLLALIMFRP